MSTNQNSKWKAHQQPDPVFSVIEKKIQPKPFVPLALVEVPVVIEPVPVIEPEKVQPLKKPIKKTEE